MGVFILILLTLILSACSSENTSADAASARNDTTVAPPTTVDIGSSPSGPSGSGDPSGSNSSTNVEELEETQTSEQLLHAQERDEVVQNDDVRAITDVGDQVLQRWWYPETGMTYGELQIVLKEEGLLLNDISIWETVADSQVEDLTSEIEIIRSEVVRIEQDNATFEVETERIGSSEEPMLTFVEFVKVDGRWRIEEIIQ